MSRLGEVFWTFLRLGLTAFGGPAAHIAMFRHEFVRRKGWLSDAQFLDLLGATNLIPGPNSTEMAIHIGLLRAGPLGLLAGGLAFTLPAVLIVLALSWAYVRYGSAPQAGWLLAGVKPVMIAIILQALWELRTKIKQSKPVLLVGLAALGLYFAGVNEVLLIFLGGLAAMVAQNWRRIQENCKMRFRRILPLAIPLLPGPFPLPPFGLVSTSFWPALAAVAQPFSLAALFLVFLKIGSVLYGSGYVLIAFLRSDLVHRLGWLTEQQLIDAIAVGQMTPGPLFTSATFIGYLLGGVPAALLATLGIFLPSYIFVAISSPLIPRLRASAWAGSLLDGVIAASLGLMAAVGWQLGRAALVDLPSALIFALSLLLLFKFRLNSTWLILLGAAAGYVFKII